jgi:prepilin-type N-terminal cleavage/methylation domain-containing protein
MFFRDHKHVLYLNSGFTMIETVIVLLIASILLTLAFAADKHFSRQKLDAAAAMIAEDIRLTQQLNMKQDGLYTMIFDFVNERNLFFKDIFRLRLNRPGLTLIAGFRCAVIFLW